MPPLTTLSPEARLLLLSAGGTRNDDAILRLLERGKLDWTRVLATRVLAIAESERAVWPLWQRVSRLSPKSVPPAAADQLQRLSMVAEFRLRMLEQRLGESLAVLERAGIDVLLFKGAALAPMVYGDFVLRPMGDLDLLIVPDRVQEARQLLLDAGWVWRRDPQLDHFYKGHHHLPPLIDGRGTGGIIELHTDLFFPGNPFRFQPELIRRHARTVRIQQWTVQVPDMLHLLMHVCMHFAWSHLLRLGAWRTFRDIDVLVATGMLDWTKFIELAHEVRGASSAYWTFRLANSLSGVSVPPHVLKALRPPLSEFVARRLEQHYAYEVFTAESRCPSEPLRSMAWELGMQPKWSGHGTIRPWQRDEEFQPTVPPTKPDLEERGFGPLARYLVSILHPRSLAE